jgi:hypothetical protein
MWLGLTDIHVKKQSSSKYIVLFYLIVMEASALIFVVKSLVCVPIKKDYHLWQVKNKPWINCKCLQVSYSSLWHLLEQKASMVGYFYNNNYFQSMKPLFSSLTQHILGFFRLQNIHITIVLPHSDEKTA